MLEKSISDITIPDLIFFMRNHMPEVRETHWIIKHAVKVTVGIIIVGLVTWVGTKLNGVYFPNIQRTTITIKASDYDSVVNVSVSTIPSYGEVILNAPPYNDKHNRAVWKFDAVEGRYNLFVEYASADSRPVTVLLNGSIING